MVKQAVGNYRILLAIIDMASKLARESIWSNILITSSRRNWRNQRNWCRDKHLRLIGIGEVSEKIPYADASRYTRRGAPGAPSLRSTCRTVIFGGVLVRRHCRLSSINDFGTLPRKHSVLI